jgi:hypothetical protein
MMLGIKDGMVHGHWHWGVKYFCLLLFDDMKWLRKTLHSGEKFCFTNQNVNYAWKTKYIHTSGW